MLSNGTWGRMTKLNMHSDKLQRILIVRECVQQINEARWKKTSPQSLAQRRTTMVRPQVAGEAISAMNDLVDLHPNSDNEGLSLKELVQSLNTDKARVYEQVQSHLKHQLKQEKKECHFTDLQPLHMFVSGVGGMGKCFLSKTVRALLSKCGRMKHVPHCVPSLLPLDLQHSMSVESPSIDCCNCPLSTRAEELGTGSWLNRC